MIPSWDDMVLYIRGLETNRIPQACEMNGYDPSKLWALRASRARPEFGDSL